MHDDAIISVFGIMVVFGAPVVAFVVARALRHQERMEMIRRGMVPPEFTDRRAYRAWRKAGSPWPPPGAQQAAPQPGQAPWVQPVPPPAWTPAPEDDPQRALFKGIRVALIGFALTIGLGALFGGFSGNPAVLGGLIPMFVGIAQIIIALISGAQLPGLEPRVTLIPPPHQPGAPPPPPGYGSQPPPAQPPPWAERPRFEELSKPAPPPDVR